jgi:hypothetical protein
MGTRRISRRRSRACRSRRHGLVDPVEMVLRNGENYNIVRLGLSMGLSFLNRYVTTLYRERAGLPVVAYYHLYPGFGLLVFALYFLVPGVEGPCICIACHCRL